MPCDIADYNRSRTTILHDNIETKKSPDFRIFKNYPIYLVTFEFFGVNLDMEKWFFDYDTIISDVLQTYICISKIL